MSKELLYLYARVEALEQFCHEISNIIDQDKRELIEKHQKLERDMNVALKQIISKIEEME